MGTLYFMESVFNACFLFDEIGKLWDKYKDKEPAPGAPVDDYMIILGQEFYKAGDASVSRACMAGAGRAKTAFREPLCGLALAAGGEGIKASRAGKSIKVKPLLIDRKFIDGLKKQARTPLMLHLATSIEEAASRLGEAACKGALADVEKGKGFGAPGSSVEWSLLPETIRAFDALAQGRPVNVPDVAHGLLAYGFLLGKACLRLVRSAYAAITTPGGLDYGGIIQSSAGTVDLASQRAAGLLATCGALPDATVGSTIPKEGFPPCWPAADFSMDEMTYLIKKAQGMTPTPAMTELKGKCAKAHDGSADPVPLAAAIAEYLDAVRNSL